MQKRQLGKSDLMVAPLAFGGNVFGWTADEKTSFELLDAFVAAGFNLIDTADVYSRWVAGHIGGESESIVGKWMKDRKNRQDVIIATKVGMDMGDGKKGLRKKYIMQAVDASLQRLQTDYIDLYQSHRDDEETPVEETLDAYTQLIKEGKVRYIGASNFSAARLKESLEASEKYGYARYETLQPEYNLYTREDVEKELEPLCLAQNISIINYYSLASGFLTGKYRSEADFPKSVRGPRMAHYLNDRGFRILAALDEISKEYNTHPASVAIAWLISRPAVGAPIASATNIAQLKELTAAAALQLSDKALQLLDEASAWQTAKTM